MTLHAPKPRNRMHRNRGIDAKAMTLRLEPEDHKAQPEPASCGR